MKRIFLVAATILSIFFVITACSNSNSSSAGEEDSNTKSSNNTSPNNHDETTEKVREFLKHEFTAPNEEVKELFSEGTRDELNEYLYGTYKPYFSEKGYENFVDKAKGLAFITRAHDNEYQLKVKDMNIEEDEKNNAFAFEIDVDYSKDGERNSTIVKGRINTNEEGIFTRVRYTDRGGLLQIR
ncbi:hypothetical protein [Halobacillus aidingensis]|uniref:Lipoprotein n=1 Tax=Halobacillus aidingensis TaxID=240303 RepID=A0A1H0QP89_HALAD|nr:hypothetical protein [Halobacillus aidingensis]SDP19177.1 hypothetical protein SAMN05421677_11379 [Halobacillus aidingensis]